jgi:hypothetical protein
LITPDLKHTQKQLIKYSLGRLGKTHKSNKMAQVIAKFKCNSVLNYEGSKTATLNAVCSTSDENKDFTKYTPNGRLEISIMNDAVASSFFEPGKEYYLDFTQAE